MKAKRIALIGISTLAIATACIALTGAGTPGMTPVHGVDWHNDWSLAVSEAKEKDRPILMLSIFGRLDEEVTCANARTLRATLMKEPEFQAMMQQEVIPVWEMVREVPKVTIDLGDGKPIRRTIRGNAVMYLCNKKGEILDVFPGVHTAKDLMPRLRESIKELAKADTARVLEYHTKLAANPKYSVPVRPTRITMGKMAMESPTLDLLGIVEPEPIRGTLANTDPKQRAFLRAAARLQDASLTPMSAASALRLMGLDAPREKMTDEELAKAIIEADSQRNINTVRPVIHLWMASLPRLQSPAEARPAILEQILKIPYRDPYFGLKDVILPGTPE